MTPIDRPCFLPLEEVRISPNSNGSVQVNLTVSRVGVQNQGRVPDQQNTLGPHGQRAHVEQSWIRLLDQVIKPASSPERTILTWKSHRNSRSIFAVFTGSSPSNAK